MKKLMIAVIAFNVLNCSIAQSDSTSSPQKKFEVGAQSGFYYTQYLPGFNYYCYFTIRRGIQQISIGPSFGRPHYFDVPFSHNTYHADNWFNGVDVSYRVLPNGPGKVFDFYFQVSYFQKWASTTANKPIYNSSIPSTDNITLSSVASQLLVEYGFDIKFLKHFYVGGAMGIGGKLDFQKYDFQTYDAYSYDETDKDIDVIVRASFGFRF